MTKRFLFLFKSGPYAGLRIRESLDMLLTTAAMDQPIEVLFLDDGVLHLLEGQQPESVELPRIAEVFKALPFYDVESFWIEQESLNERGILNKNLILPARQIARQEIGALIEANEIVVTC